MKDGHWVSQHYIRIAYSNQNYWRNVLQRVVTVIAYLSERGLAFEALTKM